MLLDEVESAPRPWERRTEVPVGPVPVIAVGTQESLHRLGDFGLALNGLSPAGREGYRITTGPTCPVVCVIGQRLARCPLRRRPVAP